MQRRRIARITVEIAPYLSKLCDSLAGSMIGESRPATLAVAADSAFVQSADAVSLGLNVTELVINTLKYAFPDPKKAATVMVAYESMARTGNSRSPTMALDVLKIAGHPQGADWAPVWYKPSPTS